MTPDPVVLVQGVGPHSISIERAPRAGEYGWSVTAYGVDANHVEANARQMAAAAESIVETARRHEAEARAPKPAAP